MRAITIGNFDGVHLGHAALVARCRAECAASPGRSSSRAGSVAGSVVAVTFEPHPVALLRPDRAPPRLQTSTERRALLAAIGCDEVVELEPTPDLLGLEPAAFIESLRRRLGFDVVVEGADFRFGRGRAGSIETLADLGSRMGFRAVVVPPVDVMLDDRTVVRASSSIVRWFLQRGRVRDAAAVLGRPYELVGRSVPGERRGRTIGVPTINLGPPPIGGSDGFHPWGQMLPEDGVYGGVALVPSMGLRAAAAISIGMKPTFGGAVRTCEAHLVDASLPLDAYGFEIRLAFTTWIREQRRFASIDRLVEQLRSDVALVRDRVSIGGRAPVPAPTG
jgi:riboflavin kinase/FMN adenylyltransferase